MSSESDANDGSISSADLASCADLNNWCAGVLISTALVICRGYRDVPILTAPTADPDFGITRESTTAVANNLTAQQLLIFGFLQHYVDTKLVYVTI